MRFLQTLCWLTCAASSLVAVPAVKDWGLSTSLGNSVGIGTFVTGYSQTPSWTTSLILNPTYKLPAFGGMPRINLSASQMVSAWWLDSYGTTATDVQNRVVFWDTTLGASMPKILDFQSSGISFGTNLGVLLPASSFSRNINRVLGFTFAAPVSWTNWGLHAGFTPSVLVWTYSDANISVPCMDMPSATINPYNSNADIEQAIQGLSIVRNGDEKLGNGRCLVSGRQNVWTLNNSLSMGWSNPNHAVNMSLTWFLNFLRPLANRPELKGDNAISHNFNEATMGRIAYSYTLPIETNMVLSAGVLSWQSSYDKAGRLTFPFFDFVTPGNNQTQIFVQATVGI